LRNSLSRSLKKQLGEGVVLGLISTRDLNMQYNKTKITLASSRMRMAYLVLPMTLEMPHQSQLMNMYWEFMLELW
jgi:hypothetical protein